MWLISWWVVGDLREMGWCDEVCRIVRAGKWLDKLWREDEDGKVALLLGKGVEGICNRVVEDVGECVLLGVVAGKEAIVVWVGCCWILVLPLLNSWTQYIALISEGLSIPCHLE